MSWGKWSKIYAPAERSVLIWSRDPAHIQRKSNQFPKTHRPFISIWRWSHLSTRNKHGCFSLGLQVRKPSLSTLWMDILLELLMNSAFLLLPPKSEVHWHLHFIVPVRWVLTLPLFFWNGKESSNQVRGHPVTLRTWLSEDRCTYLHSNTTPTCFPVIVTRRPISLLQITKGVVVCPYFVWWLKAETLKWRRPGFTHYM